MNSNETAVLQAQLEAAQRRIKALEGYIQKLENDSKAFKQEVAQQSKTINSLTEHLKFNPVQTDYRSIAKKLGIKDVVRVQDVIEHNTEIWLHGSFDIFVGQWKQCNVNAANRIQMFRPDFFEKYGLRGDLESLIYEFYTSQHFSINYKDVFYFFDEKAYDELIDYLERNKDAGKPKQQINILS